MAPSSSSTKNAAKLARAGQGKKVRFQGGTLFPVVVAIVVVLGLGLVIFARQSRPTVSASAPTQSDHWHHAYGFYLCDTWFQLSGDAEEQDEAGFVNTDFARTGIHSHDDGLMHWHPFTDAAVGSNAQLGVFLDTYDVNLSNDELEFPENQRAGLPSQQETGVFSEEDTSCSIDGVDEDAELKVVVWNNFTDTDDGTTYIADFENIRLDRDQMVVAIAFVPDNTDVGMPPWAADLPALGAVDSGQLTPSELSGLDAGTGSVPAGSVPADSVPADSVPAGSLPADTPTTTEP